MATNPQAADKALINVQVTKHQKEKLLKLASRSGMNLSAYVRMAIATHIESELIYRPLQSGKDGQVRLIAEHPSPYGQNQDQ